MEPFFPVVGKKFLSELPERTNLNGPLLSPKQRFTSQIIVTITLITATIPAQDLSAYPSQHSSCAPTTSIASVLAAAASHSSYLLSTCYIVSNPHWKLGSSLKQKRRVQDVESQHREEVELGFQSSLVDSPNRCCSHCPMLPPYGGLSSGCRLRRIKYTFAGYVTLDKSLTFFVLQFHLHNDSFA